MFHFLTILCILFTAETGAIIWKSGQPISKSIVTAKQRFPELVCLFELNKSKQNLDFIQKSLIEAPYGGLPEVTTMEGESQEEADKRTYFTINTYKIVPIEETDKPIQEDYRSFISAEDLVDYLKDEGKQTTYDVTGMNVPAGAKLYVEGNNVYIYTGKMLQKKPVNPYAKAFSNAFKKLPSSFGKAGA